MKFVFILALATPMPMNPGSNLPDDTVRKVSHWATSGITFDPAALAMGSGTSVIRAAPAVHPRFQVGNPSAISSPFQAPPPHSMTNLHSMPVHQSTQPISRLQAPNLMSRPQPPLPMSGLGYPTMATHHQIPVSSLNIPATHLSPFSEFRSQSAASRAALDFTSHQLSLESIYDNPAHFQTPSIVNFAHVPQSGFQVNHVQAPVPHPMTGLTYPNVPIQQHVPAPTDQLTHHQSFLSSSASNSRQARSQQFKLAPVRKIRKAASHKRISSSLLTRPIGYFTPSPVFFESLADVKQASISK